MSKSLGTNTNQRYRRKLALALVAGGVVAGCGGNDPVDTDGFDGIGETSFPLLQNPCTFTGSTMNLKVRTGETLYLTMRSDGKVLAGGLTAGGAECIALPTDKIAVTEDATAPGTEKVFLDYIGGNYALGTISGTTPTPGITLALGAGVGGVGSSVIVRGSTGADKIYLGSTYLTGTTTLQYNWINVNGDTAPDIRMTGVTDIKVSTGVGADIISADGGNGTTGTALDATVTLSAYGGPDADILTGGKGPGLLDGGDGDDKFPQTSTAGPDNIVGGKGTDTVDYSTRTVAVNVTVCTVCSTDPSGCIAADTTCRGNATSAKSTCDGNANTAKSTCDGNANTAKSTCDGDANSAKTTCDSDADDAQDSCHTDADDARTSCRSDADDAKTACDTAADDGLTTCLGTCSDQGCIDDCNTAHGTALGTCTSDQTTAYGTCDSDQTAAYGTCDGTHSSALTTCANTLTSSLGTCASNETTALNTCASNETTALGVCTTNYTGATSTCDTSLAACQGGITMPFCSVCTADDGGPAEGDTVNDDVEVVLGSKAGDTINATYAVCSNQAATPVVKCTLTGNDGDDAIVGSSHNDLIDGGAGNDVLQGGLGDDTFVGGAGTDTISYADRGASAPVWVSLDSAKLWVTGQNGAVGELDVIPLDVENLTGGAGNDKLRGNLNNNIIRGGAGNDLIEGGAGNDALYGEVGNDTLYGGAGIDQLFGGAGADSLYGGDGEDFLDATDSPAASDTVIDCDGVNELGGTSTAQGNTDTLVKDPGLLLDTGALHCETTL